MIRTSTLHLYTPFSHCNKAWGTARIVPHDRLFDIYIYSNLRMRCYISVFKEKNIFIIIRIIGVL